MTICLVGLFTNCEQFFSWEKRLLSTKTTAYGDSWLYTFIHSLQSSEAVVYVEG